ncbi:MAG: aspartate dehydrogenase [Clostridia bacterium]|nr:aspartate dehydrogenase [Clostridia bacterium]
MALFKKKAALPAFDPEKQEAAVRKSICTGEMTVGFVDRQTGKFQELMRVDDQRALEDFCRSVGAEKIKTIY